MIDTASLGFPSFVLVGIILLIFVHFFTSMAKTFVGLSLVLSLGFYGFGASDAQKTDMDNFAKKQLETIKNAVPDVIDFISEQSDALMDSSTD